MSRIQYIVLTSAQAGREEEFEDWYDTQHLADVKKTPGIISARRFHVEKVMGDGAPSWVSLAIYEIEAENPEDVLAEIRRRAGGPEMPMTAALERVGMLQILASDP